VTLDEWVRHYEEVSVSIDSDDYFGQMMTTTWSHLKQKMPDGSKVHGGLVWTQSKATSLSSSGSLCLLQVPALKFTPRADVDLLEKQLRKSICALHERPGPMGRSTSRS